MVEIRGVEPLTFSMPFSDGAEDGKDGRGLTPFFAGRLTFSNLLNRVSCSYYCSFVVKPPTTPAAGKSVSIKNLRMASDTQKQQLQTVGGFAVYQHHIRADVAVAASFPVVMQLVVTVFRRKRRICGE